MALAGSYDLKIVRNTDHSWVFNLKDSNGDAVNLTGYGTPTADIVGNSNVVPLGKWDLTVATTSAALGEITITLTDTDSGTFANTSGSNGTSLPDWDLLLPDSAGLISKIVKGKVYVEETYTT